MRVACEVLTKQPDGAEAYIEFDVWWKIYEFMVRVDAKIHVVQVDHVKEYLNAISSRNQDMIGPRDFLHQDCPQLQ